MGWKNLPRWLKGASVFLVLFFIVYILTFIKFPERISVILEIIILYSSIPMQLFRTAVPVMSYKPFVFNFIAGMLIYLIIGALVGWIVGKLRSR